MRVAPTGIIFYGRCEINSESCIAKNEIGPVTAVWLPHGNKQINVCNPCLKYQLKEAKWKIDGALVKDIKEVVDLAIVDEDMGKARVIIELKNKKNTDLAWAEKMIFNYANIIPEYIESFLLFTPNSLYVYKNGNTDISEIKDFTFLDPYLVKYNTSREEISVENPKDFYFNYKEVVRKHFDFQRAMLEFFQEFLKGSVAPRELSFLNDYIGQTTIKEEWIINK